jgi:hypothetical protein
MTLRFLNIHRPRQTFISSTKLEIILPQPAKRLKYLASIHTEEVLPVNGRGVLIGINRK